MKYFDYYSSPLGILLLTEENEKITRLELSEKKLRTADCPIDSKTIPASCSQAAGTDSANSLIDSAEQKNTPLIALAKSQLEEYFQGARKTFDLPLQPAGTPFQKKVWDALCTIPYGETRSYKEIALQIHNPRGCRAVGMANNRNPIMIMIPCHRVIGSNGSLVGYAGGLDIKEWLLLHETLTASSPLHTLPKLHP